MTVPDPSYEIHIRQSSDQQLHVCFWPSPTFSDSIDPTPLNRVVARLKEFLLQNCTVHKEDIIISTDAFLPRKPLTHHEWATGTPEPASRQTTPHRPASPERA